MRISKPVSAEEANAGGFEPWKPGTYDFTVQDASDETSSTGNDMIKLTLHIFNDEGRHRTVFDYLVDSPKVQYKIRHFADAVGLTEQYEAGELDINEIVERSGQLKLAIKPAQGDYPAGNQVRDYIKAVAQTKRSAVPYHVANAVARGSGAAKTPVRGGSTGSDLDDEIPFAPERR